MKLNFRTVFWIGAAVLVATLLAVAFRPQPVAVDVAQTIRGPMTVTVGDEGRTRLRHEYIVSAPVAGELLRVEHEPGDHVHKDDIVARLRPSVPAFIDARAQAEGRALVESARAAAASARADLARAEAELEFARAEVERIERLRERELSSAEALDRARLNVTAARTAVAAAEESLRLRNAELTAALVRLTQPGSAGEAAAVMEVRSPVSGRVLRVARESEAVIPAGAEIMTVGDPNDLEVVVEMLSSDALQVEPGAEVMLHGYGRDDPPISGRVRLVEPYGFTKISALGVEEQRVNVIVDFVGPSAEWSRLGHGYRVEAAIVISAAEDVVQVPVAALFRDGGEWAVFSIDGNRARRTPVRVGRNNGEYAEILEGLEPGRRVVLYPGERINDGVRVRPRNPG